MFEINIFGKPGCRNCKIMNRRVDDLLNDGYSTWFTKRYNDVTTDDGIARFCIARNINHGQIPALVVFCNDEPLCSTKTGGMRIYGIAGVQTNWNVDRGVMPACEIEDVLKEVINDSNV